MKCARNDGFILLAALILLVTAASGWLVWTLNQKTGYRVDTREQRAVLRGLRDAQLALIAHGLIEDNTPGTLPAPSSEYVLNGRSSPLGYAGNPGQSARRLPWHFLALPAHIGGECLWYATSRIHRNNLPTAQRSSSSGNAINPASISPLEFIAHAGGPPRPAAAILIAPGRPFAGQRSRLPDAGSCAEGDATSFLEGSNALPGAPFQDVTVSSQTNDILLPVLHEQLMRPILRRVLATFAPEQMRQAIRAFLAEHPGSDSLDQVRCHFISGTGTCPGRAAFDALLAGTAAEHLVYTGSCPGVSPDSASTDYKRPVSWLCFNDWYAHLHISPDAPILTVTHADYRCALGLDTGQILCNEQVLR